MNQLPKQKRIVLDSAYLPLADRILEQTGIANHSQLVAILICNYGEKLIKSLKAD